MASTVGYVYKTVRRHVRAVYTGTGESSENHVILVPIRAFSSGISADKYKYEDDNRGKSRRDDPYRSADQSWRQGLCGNI
jgi:hypothetical protein